MIVVVTKNENGKIELTEEELKRLLKDAYDEGKSGVNKEIITVSPTWEKKWQTIPVMPYIEVTC